MAKPAAHFLHVSKTGGTAIKFALRPYLDTGRYSIKLHPHKVTLADIPIGEKVFFCLRGPETRFVSGFYSRQRQGRPRIHVPWTVGEEKAFFRFATANELAKALSSEEPERRAHAAEAMQAIAHARRSFELWFGSEAEFRKRAGDILFIGFQEQLNEDFEILKRLLSLPAQAALPKDDVAAHRNPATADTRLDQEALHNLSVWYAKDRHFVELCREFRRHSDDVAAERAPAHPFSVQE